MVGYQFCSILRGAPVEARKLLQLQSVLVIHKAGTMQKL